MTADPRANPFSDSYVAMMAARALVSGTSLGVFEALADGPSDARELSDRLGLTEVGTEVLLAALESLGYLISDSSGSYRLTDVAERELLERSPESLARFVGAFGIVAWDALSGLDEALHGGRRAEWHNRPSDDPTWRAYIRGLFELSRAEHASNAALVPADEPRTLLEIAAGHGGFAMAMCRRWSGLRATILDLPGSAAVGREIVAQEGFEDRVTFTEGDALADDLGKGLDVVAWFNLTHHLSPEDNLELVKRARVALAPGGWLVLGDSERVPPGDRPSRLGALSALLYYASSGTRNYTRDEVSAWLRSAGFADVRVHRNQRSPWRLVFLARA